MNSQIKTDMTVHPMTVTGRLSLSDAQEVMRSWGMRHLPVVENEKLVGVITDRDILRAFSLKHPGTTEVQKMMSPNPYSVSEDVSVAEVAKVMAERKIGCTVVLNGSGRVTGIFTTVDALNLLARILHQPYEADYRLVQISRYLKDLKRVS